MLDPKTCKWHRCGATFTPTSLRQEFCSSKCRTDRAVWRQNRGSMLVDPLINGQWTKLKELRAVLQKEIDNG